MFFDKILLATQGITQQLAIQCNKVKHQPQKGGITMNRNDYIKSAKIYGIMVLCMLPILIGANILLNGLVAMWVLVLIDVVLLIIGYIIAQYIADKRKERIAKKREEFVARQELQKQKAQENATQVDASTDSPQQDINTKQAKDKNNNGA